MQSFNLSQDQIERYSRNILLKEIGSTGQQKLLNSRVTVIGGGGLGCPVTQMLAAAGIGHIRIIDNDKVELTNLPRQILHYTEDIGKFKVDSIKNKVEHLNSDVKVEIHKTFADQSNIKDLLSGSDFVVECSDNMGTKFLVNDACVHLDIPFTIAGVVKFYGQIVSVIPGKTTCYRCIFREVHEPDASMTCSGAGVLGTVPSFAGILQANEAIKSISGLELNFINGMFAFDLLVGSFDFVKIKKDNNCKACSNPKIPFYAEEDYGTTSAICEDQE